jgi:membrane protease YdiL (CAAX protease family)
VAVYVVLAYAISWSVWVPMALERRGVVDVPWDSHFPGLLGPLLAALVTTALVDGGAGVRDLAGRMLRLRVGWRWVALAVVGPLVLFVLALPFAVWSGDGVPSLASLGRFSGLPSAGPIGIWVLLLLVNGLGEEAGWRGFAQDRLQRIRSPLSATVTVALVWGGWHVPLFFFHDTYLGMTPFTIVGWWIGLLLGGAVVLAWLYGRASHSILLAACWHASYNWSVATEGSEGVIAAVVSAFVMVGGVWILVAEIRARRGRRASVIAPDRPAMVSR